MHLYRWWLSKSTFCFGREKVQAISEKVTKIIGNQYITLHQRMLGAFVSETFISNKALNETIFNESNDNVSFNVIKH